MNALASEVRKKVGGKKHEANKETNRCKIIRCKCMREKTRMLIKEKNTEFENKWKEHLGNREKGGTKTEGIYNNSRNWQRGEEEPTKIKMHTNIKLTACNVREINTLGKRQELARQWGKMTLI